MNGPALRVAALSRLRPAWPLLALLGALSGGCGEPHGTTPPRPPPPVAVYDAQGGCAGRPAGEDPARRPDVLLVALNRQRARRPTDDPVERAGTAWLAPLEARALAFGNAATSAVHALPALASLLTGRLPSEHGIAADGDQAFGLAPLPTAAEILGRCGGYRTRALLLAVTWPGGPGTPLEGFEEVQAGLDLEQVRAALSEPPGPEPLFTLLVAGSEAAPQPQRAPGAQDPPAPGAPGDPPSDLGALLSAWLKTGGARGPSAPAWLVVAGLRGSTDPGSDDPLAALSLAESLLRVPLLFAGSAPFEDPRAIPASVGLVDVLPTLLEALALPPLGDAEGRSLLALRTGGGPGHPTRAQLVRNRAQTRGRSDAVLESVRSDRWKYVVAYERAAGTVLESAFDLSQDPSEGRDLAGAGGRVVGLPLDLDTCRAVEQVRDRLWASLAGSGLLHEHGYEGGTARVDAPRPPSACGPPPAGR